MKVGNSCGFWGDDPDASRRLLEAEPGLDFLTLDYLAEVSLSIMAIQKEKDPALGYARDFIEVVKSLIPYWKSGGKCKIITNGGGLNPNGLADACLKILHEADLKLKIGVITGDDVLQTLKEYPEKIKDRIVTANAYVGAKPIAVALDIGADIVIAGRIADPSLTVGPCLHYYRWPHDAYDSIAGATIAGHLIECGTQVTGGISTDWLEMSGQANIGYPIAEIFDDGVCVITKPQGTGGQVTERTVKEQLLYEIADPACYKSPDATVSFLNLRVQDEGNDRVRVDGALGTPPPYTLKVSTTYRAGYKAESTLALFGSQVLEKAKKAGEIVFAKVKEHGFTLEKTLIETIGSDTECILRIAARDLRKEALEVFVKQIAPLVTAGPQGTTGYISGRAEIRPVFGFWPGLIESNQLKINIELRQ